MAAYLLHSNDLETVQMWVGFRGGAQGSDKELQAPSISGKQWGRSLSILAQQQLQEKRLIWQKNWCVWSTLLQQTLHGWEEGGQNQLEGDQETKKSRQTSKQNITVYFRTSRASTMAFLLTCQQTK